MPVKLAHKADAEKKRQRKTAAVAEEADQELLFALKAKRSAIARRENVPAYIVFHDRTLADMAAKAPVSMAELMEVSGVGEKKAERYGEEFLSVLREFAGE